MRFGEPGIREDLLFAMADWERQNVIKKTESGDHFPLITEYPRKTVMQRSGRGMHSRGDKKAIERETVEKRKYPKILQEYKSPAYQYLRR